MFEAAGFIFRGHSAFRRLKRLRAVRATASLAPPPCGSPRFPADTHAHTPSLSRAPSVRVCVSLCECARACACVCVVCLSLLLSVSFRVLLPYLQDQEDGQNQLVEDFVRQVHQQVKMPTADDPEVLAVAVFHQKHSISSRMEETIAMALEETHELVCKQPVESNLTLLVFGGRALIKDIGYTLVTLGSEIGKTAVALDISMCHSACRIVAGTLDMKGVGGAKGAHEAQLSELAECMTGQTDAAEAADGGDGAC